MRQLLALQFRLLVRQIEFHSSKCFVDIDMLCFKLASAAWADDEEESMKVNIAAAPRARKLRRAEDEAVVTGTEYAERLKKQFESGAGDTSWAAVASGAREGSDGEQEDVLQRALRSTAPAVAKATTLGQTHISMTRCVDANISKAAKAVVSTVQWHPEAQRNLLMAASGDKALRFYSIDGENNPMVASAFCESMPVTAAGFAQGGAEVLAVGRRPFFYTYDVATGALSRTSKLIGREEKSWESLAVNPAAMGGNAVHALFGRHGSISLVSARSKQWVGELKMNGEVRAGAFSTDGMTLVTVGTEGAVYHWDMRMHKCITRHDDDGLSPGTAVAVDSSNSTLAVGSKAGVVNLYDTSSMPREYTPSMAAAAGAFAPLGGAPAGPATTPTLRKGVMNLTTPIDTLAFNHDGQIMVMGSRRLQDQMRLLHVPSGTVYQNWPTAATPLHYVESAAFSGDSRYLAIGNDRGRVLLYTLNHYSS